MDYQLQLNLAQTELLVVSANPSLHHSFSIQLGASTITPSRTARNLGVVIDNSIPIQVYLYSAFYDTIVAKHFTGNYNPKSEKVGTVWKTQIKKESSDF